MILLPLLVAGSTWLQQKLTTTGQPTSTDPQAAQMQQSMSVTMPLMFGFFAMQMPSGLSIYFIVSNLIGMAIATGTRWIGAWVSDHALVGGLFVWRLIATMTFDTGNLTVYRRGKSFPIDQNFLPWLQRSHRSPSANPAGFAFIDLFDGGGNGDELVFVCVAVQTLINGGNRR